MVKLLSMEPTPSPYAMKINVSETLPDGTYENYKSGDDLTDAPDYIKKLFQIEGIKGLYRVVDFITVERHPKVAWEEILPQVAKVFGSKEDTLSYFTKAATSAQEAYGAVQVFVQMIRNIPTQVKLIEGDVEKRFALPQRMMDAAMQVAAQTDDYLRERKWVEERPRYGDIDEIGKQVVEELAAEYDEARLQALVTIAQRSEKEAEKAELPRKKVTLEMLEAPNWRDRYAALAQMPDPTEADYPLLDKALEDEHPSVRRLATAYLGMIEEKATLPYLYKALRDRSVNVRRTAGDCLSDLGFKEAIPEMIKTLKDPSRIVRWRGAMFLYEFGDESAIPALEEALEDPEFEVRMQAKMALERIKSGQKAEGSIWQQMKEVMKKEQ